MPQVRETDKFYFNSYGGKERKFLCIGGPHDGKYLSSSQVHPDYDTFNTAGSARGYRVKKHRQIHVHRGLLYPDPAG